MRVIDPVQGCILPSHVTVDVCIFGGTASGVAAAVQLRRLGRSVVLLEPGNHLGGMSSGGLSYTDFGNKAAIGGIAREFYRRTGAKYGVEEEWKFEPHVAEEVFNELVAETGTPVYFGQRLASVRMNGRRIAALTAESGLTVSARVFLDTTYEGDLMARAGVSFTVGREGNAVYGETLNGTQVHDKHQFNAPVDPYIVSGDASSGLLPGIESQPVDLPGTGDDRIQAYNFRLCVTRDPANRMPFTKPIGYDPREYVLLARLLATGWNEVFRKFDPIRAGKFDVNNHGGISTDFIGRNYAYPEAGYAERERIVAAHRTYQEGWLWFLANDPSVPESIRAQMRQYGLCRDEFCDHGGWPHQIYVREARRMVSDYVMREQDCRGLEAARDPVGLGAYNMDSHNCRRFVEEGRVRNEGDVQIGVRPYPISYRALVPREEECDNLLVPVCLSASHIAYGSIRMEPVFMILGQSAALAADRTLTEDAAVQEISYDDLRVALEAAGQALTLQR